MAQSIKGHMTDLLSLPKEIILNLPLITITGSEEITIENYKNIIEYTDTKIRVNTSSGVLVIDGLGLALKALTAEYITVAGAVVKIEYLR